MQKVIIQVEETLRYEAEIQVIQPDGMTDAQFEAILTKAEKENYRFNGGAKELATILEKYGLKVVSKSLSFPESPRDSELEIVDVRNCK